MTRSRALYEELVASAQKAAENNSWADWLATCPLENDILDWKAGDAYTRPKKDGESEAEYKKETEERLKEVWSQFCSAFGNTSGGVLVFGLGEGGGTRDRPTQWRLCFDVVEARRRLLDWSRSNCEPPVSHIEIEAIMVDAQQGKGILICHIPESLAKPHKALSGSKPDFYLRLHDGCYPCPVSLLRSLFLLNAEPRLEMELTFKLLSRQPQVARGVDVEWSLEVINTGENSIRDLRIATEVAYPYITPPPALDFWIAGPGSDWERKKRESGPTEFRREPLHPGDRSLLYGGTFTVNRLSFSAVIAGMELVGFGFSIVVSALDMRRKNFIILLSHQEMMDLAEATLRITVDPFGESHTEIRKGNDR
jgi:hypothetical protein